MAIADDGIQVWVDDRLIINQWQGQAATSVYPDPERDVARRTVRVVCCNAAADAAAIVHWAVKT